MNVFDEWLKDRRCRTCGSPRFELGNALSPATEVRCGGCGTVLGNWGDFVQAVQDDPEASRVPKRNRSRSTTVQVWSQLGSRRVRDPLKNVG